jgi:hypothetical protein
LVENCSRIGRNNQNKALTLQESFALPKESENGWFG